MSLRLSSIPMKWMCCIFGYIRNFEKACKCQVPYDIKKMVLLTYHNDEYFESIGNKMSTDKTHKILQMSTSFFPSTYNTAFGSTVIDASLFRNYQWEFKISRKLFTNGGICIGIICIDDMTEDLLSIYHETDYYRRQELHHYSFRSNAIKTSKEFGDQHPYLKPYDGGDTVTMTLNINSSLHGTLSFSINDKPKQNAFFFFCGAAKYKMVVSLYKGCSVELLKYTEYGTFNDVH